MSARFDCSDPEQRALGIEEATAALRRGELVVLPTDTVYGVAADAFDPAAVASLLAAKGRSRQAPPPVLVGTVRAASALVEYFGSVGEDLIDQFWPGGLTLVCRASRSLAWDLGDTKGTVAIRMPLHPVALDLLRRTGPLAVSGAQRGGHPAATTAAEAEAQFGAEVGVYLDDGACPASVPSTIVDLTGTVPRLLRAGVVPIERLREVIALAVTDAADENVSGASTPTASADTRPPGADTPTVGEDAPASAADTPASAADTRPPGADTPTVGEDTPASEMDMRLPVANGAAAGAEAGEGGGVPTADEEASSG